MINVSNSDQDYKAGLSAFLFAEKKLNKMFSIKPEFGYLQKGFKNNVDLRSDDGTLIDVSHKNVIFHDLGLNVGLKFTPFHFKRTPYILLGIRGDYMFAYKDIIFEEPGSGLKFNLYKSSIDAFKKGNLGGLLGIGLEYNNLCFLELDYNPTLTNSYNTNFLVIKDNCWDLKLGLNIHKLLK
jgi:hypothetical protein